MRWTLLHSPDADGATNMARDEALLALVREDGGGWLRVYGWTHPVLSLGRHQRSRGVYDPVRAAERGVEIVRRPTGGRAVLHFREITYAAAAPITAGETLHHAAARVDQLLVHALAALGVEARVAQPSGRAPVPDGAPCFALPVRGELLAGGRKLVGSAQWREEDAWLQHGSILVEDDQALLPELAVQPDAQQVGEVATLAALTGRVPATGEFARALHHAARGLDPQARFLGAHEAEHARLDRAADELRARYLDPSWTWRR